MPIPPEFSLSQEPLVTSISLQMMFVPIRRGTLELYWLVGTTRNEQPCKLSGVIEEQMYPKYGITWPSTHTMCNASDTGCNSMWLKCCLYNSSLIVETVAPVSRSAGQVMLSTAMGISFGIHTSWSLLMGRSSAEPDPWPQDLAYWSLNVLSYGQCSNGNQGQCVLLVHICSKWSCWVAVVGVSHHLLTRSMQAWV